MGRRKYQYMQPSDLPDDYDVTHHDIWLGLKEITSAHGLPHVTRARGPVKKAFWGITVFLTVGALVYNIYAITKLFADHPVTVTINLLHENEVVFPAVTICNMSPVRKSLAETSAAVQDALDRKRRRRRRRKRAGDSGMWYCEADWEMLYNTWYCVSVPKDNLSYETAVEKCLNLKYAIVTMKNQSDDYFTDRIRANANSHHFWMAFHSSLTFDWVWLSSEQVSNTDWISNTTNPDLCVWLEENGLWPNYNCSTIWRYICERAAHIYLPDTPASKKVASGLPTSSKTAANRTQADPTLAETNMTMPESAHVDPTLGSANDSAKQPSVASSCCCSCCLRRDSYGTVSSSSCAAHTNPDASTCAYNKWMQDPITVPTSSWPIEEEPEPQPVEGSKFPERVETRENFKEEEKLTEALAGVDDTEKQMLGTQAKDFFLDCQFSGYSCYLRDFTPFYNPIHGNCYIFNSGWNSTTPLKKSHRAGKRYGLHLIINIDQDEYMNKAGDTAGVRLVVHSQDRMPFPEDEGLTIETGHSTSLGIRKVIIERQPHPYGSCRLALSGDYSDNVFQELYPVNYSTTSCIKTCYQQHVIRQCQCADAELPLNGRAFGDDVIDVCDSSDIEQSDCKYEVRQLFNQNKLECFCPASCRDVDFQVEVSTGVWPSNVQRRAVLERLAPKIGKMLSDPRNPDKYKENLVKLEIYYQEFNFEEVRETPSYPPQKYLSDLGGVLGLWLGMSIFTICEFIEFFLDLIVLRCSGMRSKNKVTSFGRDKETAI